MHKGPSMLVVSLCK